MKGGTVQINWHDTKPVVTLDFHLITGLLATGDADFDIEAKCRRKSQLLHIKIVSLTMALLLMPFASLHPENNLPLVLMEVS